MAQMAGPDPIWMNCPNCNTEILTTTQKSLGTFQMLVAGGLCCFGFALCFYIPFCIDDWKDVLHTCPNCNYGIGKFKKLWSSQKRNHQKKLLINHFSIWKFQHWIKYYNTLFQWNRLLSPISLNSLYLMPHQFFENCISY